MEDLILIVLRIFFEILLAALDGLTYWPLDFGVERVSEKCPLWLVLCLYFIGGCFLGWLSLAILPHTWLRSSSLRILNLVISPIVAGSIGYLSATHFYRDRSDVRPQDHLWSGVFFALGLAAVRFAYCTR